MEVVALALLIDALVGDPAWLWRRTGHPVTWFGTVIDGLDRRFNRGPAAARRLAGVLALLGTVLLFALPAAILAAVLAALPVSTLLEAAAASTLLAQRSLHEHVARVADAPSPEAARTAVGAIVGRDTANLDETGISRAALESLAESLSDGVVAPAFWLAIGGLPGLVAYKIVNTADSMIGHLSPRHAAYGWAAARLDDLLNLVPARLTAVLVLLVPPRLGRLGTVADEAARHASPNAGWPEAAFAQSLGVSLGGPRRYDGEPHAGPWFNRAGRAPERADIRRGLRLAFNVGLVHGLAYAVLGLLV
jgi:adenosylcobinamide-phosphate synthase